MVPLAHCEATLFLYSVLYALWAHSAASYMLSMHVLKFKDKITYHTGILTFKFIF